MKDIIAAYRRGETVVLITQPNGVLLITNRDERALCIQAEQVMRDLPENLGWSAMGPDAPTVKRVRAYLKDVAGDPSPPLDAP